MHSITGEGSCAWPMTYGERKPHACPYCKASRPVVGASFLLRHYPSVNVGVICWRMWCRACGQQWTHRPTLNRVKHLS